ncbi:hypothetical protein AVEN_149989-1 [Araneus ventricosus]|uniref:Uncharacterized protein n=1 Tax=Araneus ventricosus TaxID=182803 RepID=A0A4Y2BQQ9_ARAVE|nr:hypothetical protein AVEN_149989-1 [Araneus ventricosus]
MILCLDDGLLAFLFEVWRWLPHMPRHCINTLRGIVKCRANSTTTAIIAVRQVKPFEVGRESSMLREEDNILCNPPEKPLATKERTKKVRSQIWLAEIDSTYKIDEDSWRGLLTAPPVGGRWGLKERARMENEERFSGRGLKRARARFSWW